MSDPIYRVETTHIDEVTRTATSTIQWFLENKVKEGTHPVTHNNPLTLFICGQEGFTDIANEIRQAKGTIDIICWGFDPGMELVRGNGSSWPRGDCYGDLLIAAAKRGVSVRLLVWYDPALRGPLNPRNMPGYTHDTSPWLTGSGSNFADKISAQHSRTMLEDYCKQSHLFKQLAGLPLVFAQSSDFPMRPEDIPLKARAEYCHSWYQAVTHGLLEGIELRTRKGSASDIERSLNEAEQPLPLALHATGVEREGMLHAGTHHQKPILIDFAYDEGSKAVGYVMGLNSMTDYWDNAEHYLEDTQREKGGKREVEERLQGVEDGKGFLESRALEDPEIYVDDRDYKKIVQLTWQAAERQHWKAMLNLASLYVEVRALKILHEGVKLGCEACANDLAIEFGSPFNLADMLAPFVDKARGERYNMLGDALGFNPDRRFPNLDKILPLPPADLPKWDGEKKTLLAIAMGVTPQPSEPLPSAASQFSGRSFLEANYRLKETGHTSAELYAPISGYWRPVAHTQPEHIRVQLEKIPAGLYRKAEKFDRFMNADSEVRSLICGVVWEYLLTVIHNSGSVEPRAVPGLARAIPRDEPPLSCSFPLACPVSGIWQPWVSNEHALQNIVNQYWRQAWRAAGQSFPQPEDDWLLALSAREMTWHLMERSE